LLSLSWVGGGGRALSKGRKAKVEEDLAALALEIRDLLKNRAPAPTPTQGVALG
jgi:hypothetical protein